VEKEQGLGLAQELIAQRILKQIQILVVLLIVVLGVAGLEDKVVSLGPERVLRQTVVNIQIQKPDVRYRAGPLVVLGLPKNQLKELAQSQR
jgi:hypothetical protein